MESELLSLGIASKHSRPYHPQTCGKVERFHQTLKKYLAKQDPAPPRSSCSASSTASSPTTTTSGPTAAIGRRTPAEAFAAREKAYPTGPRIDTLGYRVRHDKIVQDRQRHPALPRPAAPHRRRQAAYKGWRVILLVAGREIRILTLDGTQLRRLTLDPTKDYQPMA